MKACRNITSWGIAKEAIGFSGYLSRIPIKLLKRKRFRCCGAQHSFGVHCQKFHDNLTPIGHMGQLRLWNYIMKKLPCVCGVREVIPRTPSMTFEGKSDFLANIAEIHYASAAVRLLSALSIKSLPNNADRIFTGPPKKDCILVDFVRLQSQSLSHYIQAEHFSPPPHRDIWYNVQVQYPSITR